MVSCKSSLNCRGPKSQRVCVIIVVHAASLPKTKCSSCPTCVSARAVLSPQLYGLLTAGVTALSVEGLNLTDLFLFVSFFHINSVKTVFSPQKCVYKRTKDQNRICFCTRPCTKRQRWKNRSRKSFFQLLYAGIGGRLSLSSVLLHPKEKPHTRQISQTIWLHR